MKEKKKEIINAAIDVLAIKNYESMKTNDIAEKAGIGHGTIYLYFKSKQEIFLEVLKFIIHEVEELFFMNINQDNSFLDNLKCVGNNFYLQKKETEKYYKILYKAFSEVDDIKIKEILNEKVTYLQLKIKNIILWAIEKKEISLNEDNADIAALMLYGIGDIIWQKDIIAMDDHLEQKEMDKIIDFIFNLFKKP